MPDVPARDPALEFYYFGFYRVLRRFRVTTVAGWCVAAAGVAAIMLRWEPVWSGDLAGGLLCALLVAAGVLLVQQGVSELTSYTSIPFPVTPDGNDEQVHMQSAVSELSGIMEGVEEGGWQDALQALAALGGVGERYHLPKPDGSPGESSGANPNDH